MSFFEPPPPPPKPDGPRFEMPEWMSAPENVLPGGFPLEVVLAHTDDVAVFVHTGSAYPKGFEFTLGVRAREQIDRRRNDPVMAWHEGSLDDDVIRFGILLADGRKATVFDRRPIPGTDQPPPEAVCPIVAAEAAGRVGSTTSGPGPYRRPDVRFRPRMARPRDRPDAGRDRLGADPGGGGPDGRALAGRGSRVRPLGQTALSL